MDKPLTVTLTATTMSDGRTLAFIPDEYQVVSIDGQQAIVSNRATQKMADSE